MYRKHTSKIVQIIICARVQSSFYVPNLMLLARTPDFPQLLAPHNRVSKP